MRRSHKPQVVRFLRNALLRQGRIPFEPAILPLRNSFLTWHRRPFLIPRASHRPGNDFSNLGIVLQGPVIGRRNFTIETIRGYAQMFPGCKIVLSTWVDSPKDLLIKAKEHNCEVLISEKPEHPGPYNFNLQLRSSKVGLEWLGCQGIEFAIKQRTDQRMYSPNAASYLIAMARFFPATDGEARLFSASLNSFTDRPYGLSDMFQFSRLEEVRRFWDCEEVKDTFDLPETLDNIPEIFLTYRYLQGRVGGETITSWGSALRHYLGIVDASALDMLWPKYSRREYLWRRYNDERGLIELSHTYWISNLSRE